MVEPWYSSDYNVRKIDPELIEAWNSCDPIPELHLPEPNKFIPTDFDLVPRNEADAGSDGPSLPSQVKVRKCFGIRNLCKAMTVIRIMGVFFILIIYLIEPTTFTLIGSREMNP